MGSGGSFFFFFFFFPVESAGKIRSGELWCGQGFIQDRSDKLLTCTTDRVCLAQRGRFGSPLKNFENRQDVVGVTGNNWGVRNARINLGVYKRLRYVQRLSVLCTW